MICPNCKSCEPDNRQFCSVCGANLMAAQAPYQQSYQQQFPPPPQFQQQQFPPPPQFQQQQFPPPPQFQQQPYQYQQYRPIPPQINNWLIPAILATIFCCQITGIPAIVYASKVNSLIAGGNYAEAQKSADSARNWTIISMVLGLLFFFFMAVASEA